MNQKSKSTLRSLAIIVVVALGAYFLNVEYQSHLGRKAIDATGLKMLSFDDALAESRKTGKPVLAELSAIWCPSCRRLDSEVLAHETVKAKIESDYLFARIEFESDEGAAFMERYQVSGFPNLLLIDGDGNKLKHLPRTFSPKEFLAAL